MSLLSPAEDTIANLNFDFEKTAKALKQLLFRPERAVRHAGEHWTAEEREGIPPSFRQAG